MFRKKTAVGFLLGLFLAALCSTSHGQFGGFPDPEATIVSLELRVTAPESASGPPYYRSGSSYVAGDECWVQWIIKIHAPIGTHSNSRAIFIDNEWTNSFEAVFSTRHESLDEGETRLVPIEKTWNVPLVNTPNGYADTIWMWWLDFHGERHDLDCAFCSFSHEPYLAP